jgi:hypothetical protein
MECARIFYFYVAEKEPLDWSTANIFGTWGALPNVQAWSASLPKIEACFCTTYIRGSWTTANQYGIKTEVLLGISKGTKWEFWWEHTGNRKKKQKYPTRLSKPERKKKNPEFSHWLHAISFFFKMVCHRFQHGLLFPIINWGYLLRFWILEFEEWSNSVIDCIKAQSGFGVLL